MSTDSDIHTLRAPICNNVPSLCQSYRDCALRILFVGVVCLRPSYDPKTSDSRDLNDIRTSKLCGASVEFCALLQNKDYNLRRSTSEYVSSLKNEQRTNSASCSQTIMIEKIGML